MTIDAASQTVALLVVEQTREGRSGGGVGCLGMMHTPITCCSRKDRKGEDEEGKDSATTHAD